MTRAHSRPLSMSQFTRSRAVASMARISAVMTLTACVATSQPDPPTSHALVPNGASQPPSAAQVASDGSRSVRGPVWRRIGPAHASIASVILPDSARGRIYVAASGVGVLRSDDGGASFASSDAGSPKAGLAALIASATDPDRLVAGTFGQGAWYSTDGGVHWAASALDHRGRRSPPRVQNEDLPASAATAETACITSLAATPGAAGVVYAAGLDSCPVQRSEDFGAHFVQACGGLPYAGVATLAVDPHDPMHVCAGTAGAGLWCSTSGGHNWQRIGKIGYVWSIAFEPTGTLYVGTDRDGLLRTADAGGHFEPLGLEGAGAIQAVALDPRDARHVLASTARGAVFESVDGGAHFARIAAIEGLVSSLSVAANGTLYVGTGSSGLYRRVKGGALESVVMPALDAAPAQHVKAVSLDPHDPRHVYLSINEGGLFRSVDAGETWQLASHGLDARAPRKLAFHPQKAGLIYAGTVVGDGVYASLDDGLTWTRQACGEPETTKWNVAFDPHSGDVLCAANRSGIWRSPGPGRPFVRVDEGRMRTVRDVFPDPRRPGRLYVTNGGALNRSDDGGATWTPVLGVGTRSVTFDPVDPQRIFVATQRDGVYRSIDGGATFTAMNEGLANRVMSRNGALAIDPRHHDVINAATEGGGIYRSENGGQSWSPMNDGLDSRLVFGIELDPRNPDVIYAATAAGAWKMVKGGAK